MRMRVSTVAFTLAAATALAVQPVTGDSLLWSAGYALAGRLGVGHPLQVDGSGAVTLAGFGATGYFLLRLGADGSFDRIDFQNPTQGFLESSVAVDGQGRALWTGQPSQTLRPASMLARHSFGGGWESLLEHTYITGVAIDVSADDNLWFAYNRADLVTYGVWNIGAGWSTDLGPGLINRDLIRMTPSASEGVVAWSWNAGLVRVDATGALAWQASPPLASGGPVLSTLGPQGRVYASGPTATGGAQDFLIAAFDASGAELWQRTFDGAGHGSDVPAAIATDLAGSVYVTGRAHGAGGNADFLTLKYDADGNLLWSRTYDNGGDDMPAGIALDAAGNAWVTGASAGLSGSGVLTVKYDSSGNPLFSHWMGTPGPPTLASPKLDSWGNATVALDAAGQIVVLRYGEAPTTVGPLAFQTVDPCRAFDSRDPALGGPAPLAGPSDRTIPLAGVCGMPSTAKAVSLNVTAVGSTQPGNLVLFPAGQTAPLTSVVNYSTGQTRANDATVGLGPNADLALRVNQGSGSVHVLVDVLGYWQ